MHWALDHCGVWTSTELPLIKQKKRVLVVPHPKDTGLLLGLVHLVKDLGRVARGSEGVEAPHTRAGKEAVGIGERERESLLMYILRQRHGLGFQTASRSWNPNLENRNDGKVHFEWIKLDLRTSEHLPYVLEWSKA